MPIERAGVFITTNKGPQNPPQPLPGLTFTKVVAPVGATNTTVPINFKPNIRLQGAWFTPVDGYQNIASFNQILVQSVNGNQADLTVSAASDTASIIGIIYGLT